MIWESWQYLMTSPQIKQAKTLGFLKESIALSARAKRCQKEWSLHYEQCRQTINRAASRAVQKRTILIFGAGTLNDIPIDSLAVTFQQVILVDLVFLEAARRKAGLYENVRLVEHDVTESIHWIEEGMDLVQQPNRWLDSKSIDLVISLNLVTQLPLIPVRWLINKYNYSEQQADIVGKQLIYAHLNYLRQFAGEVCLIADRADHEFDKQGKLVDQYDPWWDIEAPQAESSWEWEVVPPGEGIKGHWQKNTVGVSFL